MRWLQVEKTEIIHGFIWEPCWESQGADLSSSELIKAIKNQYFKNDRRTSTSMEESHQLS